MLTRFGILKPKNMSTVIMVMYTTKKQAKDTLYFCLNPIGQVLIKFIFRPAIQKLFLTMWKILRRSLQIHHIAVKRAVLREKL